MRDHSWRLSFKRLNFPLTPIASPVFLIYAGARATMHPRRSCSTLRTVWACSSWTKTACSPRKTTAPIATAASPCVSDRVLSPPPACTTEIAAALASVACNLHPSCPAAQSQLFVRMHVSWSSVHAHSQFPPFFLSVYIVFVNSLHTCLYIFFVLADAGNPVQDFADLVARDKLHSSVIWWSFCVSGGGAALPRGSSERRSPAWTVQCCEYTLSYYLSPPSSLACCKDCPHII